MAARDVYDQSALLRGKQAAAPSDDCPPPPQSAAGVPSPPAEGRRREGTRQVRAGMRQARAGMRQEREGRQRADSRAATERAERHTFWPGMWSSGTGKQAPYPSWPAALLATCLAVWVALREEEAGVQAESERGA